MRNINLEISIPADTAVVEVKAFLAAIRYVLAGFFPSATMKATMPLTPRSPAGSVKAHAPTLN